MASPVAAADTDRNDPIFIVDAFSAVPFAGNPAAVCVLDREVEPRWMQAVAAEMNLSETAFVRAEGDGFALRWFTPRVEVALCGHATLATSHVLWSEGYLEPGDTARFATLSGELRAARREGRIELDFPARPAEHFEPRDDLEVALGARPLWVGRAAEDDLVLLADETTVLGLEPDLGALRFLERRGVIVTAPADVTPEADFVSRFFGPGVGIDEDPVTGSAHCTLGPFWGERLGRRQLRGYQASHRGGYVTVRLEGDRVFLGGQAFTVVRGTLQA